MSELIRAWLIAPILLAISGLQASFNTLKKEIEMNQIELVGKLNDLSITLDVISGESKGLIAEVKALKEAVASAGQTTAEVDAALAAVLARVSAIDALVPNVPGPSA